MNSVILTEIDEDELSKLKGIQGLG